MSGSRGFLSVRCLFVSTCRLVQVIVIAGIPKDSEKEFGRVLALRTRWSLFENGGRPRPKPSKVLSRMQSGLRAAVRLSPTRVLWYPNEYLDSFLYRGALWDGNGEGYTSDEWKSMGQEWFRTSGFVRKDSSQDPNGHLGGEKRDSLTACLPLGHSCV